jgi:hypothetical protein
MGKPFVWATATMLDSGWNIYEYLIDNLKANIIPTFAFHSFYPAGKKWGYIREYYNGAIGRCCVYYDTDLRHRYFQKWLPCDYFYFRSRGIWIPRRWYWPTSSNPRQSAASGIHMASVAAATAPGQL